ncbi:MAG: alpha-galactosidase [Chitinophagaceae bacterium]|nr:alpha-galactosidase [Chitinophagaceae bacterium]
MLKKSLRIFCFLFFVLIVPHFLNAQSVISNSEEKNGTRIFSLSNDKVVQKVFVKNNILEGDVLEARQNWLTLYHKSHFGVATDGNFRLKMMWTDWSAPGREVNGDLAVAFSKKDFKYQSFQFLALPDGGKELEIFFTPVNRQNTTQLKLTYQLLPEKFYARRKISVMDSLKESNWLDRFISRTGSVFEENRNEFQSEKRTAKNTGSFSVPASDKSQTENNRIIKKGAFGQPGAIDFSNGGVFFGIEYPAANTSIRRNNAQRFDLNCEEIIGTVVKNKWIDSKWVVEGLAPDHHVRNWFYSYIPDIKYAQDKPYALYNSWYDLRTPVFKGLAPQHVMNEKNVLDIINAFKKNMIDPYGIHLDAFVLDDGWDKHHSDWQLRKTTFPNGLRPISDALKPFGTTLGIWYGPTGGYDFREDRINWMREHGYEVIGHGGNSMMDIGGTKYNALFKKRTTTMVRNGGVGYFKWDGLQFSSSDPAGGHPIGLYSRRALLDSFFSDCEAVRAVNPDVYLNVTSGTWLSPWWLSQANQIWMQGEDFGFADVPSVNQRDASMTYKDMVLYNDFHNQDNWFPVSNLMTHGIIKGVLNEIGGADDPLNKFTDDAMFYFGRGVSMYELYISPDLLNAGEWNALSKSLKWAENRFPILDHTFMVGGNPAKSEAYGYVHYLNNKGIIAVRNPVIQNQTIHLKLNPADGLNPEANSLVLERVYPSHWISPNIYSAGAEISIPLDGYESAIYELYPLDSADKPLLADVIFNLKSDSGNHFELNVLSAGSQARLLNPEVVSQLKIDGQNQLINNISLSQKQPDKILKSQQLSFKGSSLESTLDFSQNVITPRFIVFLHPDSLYAGKDFPEGKIMVDGKEVESTQQKQNGVWDVFSFVLPENNSTGKHTFRFELSTNKDVISWSGEADIYLIAQQRHQVQNVSVTTKRIMDPQPAPPGPFFENATKEVVKIGGGKINL